ncbi:hypothetical protein BK144_07450 [Paenibacillus sp. FSL R7-0273]|nr:hypothetical protein BK144_07450 [Paenibacillus sp. FSL R7-0273]
MKLRNKLIISYFVASVVPILLISLTIYQLSAKSVEDATSEFAAMYVSQATMNLDSFVERHDQSTKSVFLEEDIMEILSGPEPDNMDELINDRAAIQRFFARITTTYTDIDTVMLVNAEGTLYHYTRALDRVSAEELESRTWFKQSRNEKRLFLTPVHDRSYYSRNKEGAAFTVGRVLWNFNGSYAGMILLDMNPDKLIALSDDFRLLGNKYDIRLIITNPEGGILYHSGAATGKVSWDPLIGQVYPPEGSGKDEIILSRTANAEQLLVRAEIPLNKLLAKIRSIKHVTMVSIIISLLFIFLISVLFSYRITKPIINLRRSMKQVEMGQYSLLPAGSGSHDEINGLVQSYNKMIVVIKELIEDVYIAGLKRKQAQFLALQSQINPHMLYNTLESIRMKAVVKQQNDIAEMIKILARMFRLSMGKDRDSNLVRHEVEYAAHYIFLQNIRYDNRFILDVQLSDRVLDTPVIPLVFQPIVENSIKHGFRNYARQLHIRIEEHILESGDVRIRFIDDGGVLTEQQARDINQQLQRINFTAYDPEEENGPDTEQGIGLRNIAERLKLQYGERYELVIYAGDRIGTVVELIIPLAG